MIAAAIALGVIATLSTVAGTGLIAPAQWPDDPLWVWALRVAVVLGAWVVLGPVWVLLGFGGGSRQAPDARHEHADRAAPADPPVGSAAPTAPAAPAAPAAPWGR